MSAVMSRFLSLPSLVLLYAVLLPLATAHAQVPTSGRTPLPDASPPILTMDQAVALAHRNNPDFLATKNNRRNASYELRSAYGALLPRLSASLGGQYQQGGQQFFNGVSLSSNSDVLQSSYDIGVQYSINAASFIAPRVQRANSKAVDADIAGAASTLAALVKQDYLSALQSLAQSELQDSLVANATV
ncbi:MAG: TolC family protein, partial [Gemmatimonadaceae bacterium]